MSHYIRCPKCLEETLDSDCLRCSECGHDEPLPKDRWVSDREGEINEQQADADGECAS